jgi:RHS repeat-associated protein
MTAWAYLLCWAGPFAWASASPASTEANGGAANVASPPVKGPDETSERSTLEEVPLTLEGPLAATPGWPSQAEQLHVEEEAKRASPQAAAERAASRTKFANLSSEQAAAAAAESFPKLVLEPAGGPPKLPAGEEITRFLSDSTAQLALGEGKHAVLASLMPMARESSPGQWAPVDLGLKSNGTTFEAKQPRVAVGIPRRLGDGVSLPTAGLSLTPVTAEGTALAGSAGVVDGASVLYANTLPDADTLVKPTTTGFEADAILRSPESPQQLRFRVGLPDGTSLVSGPGASGYAQVLRQGTVIATIDTPVARDAAGAAVPVSMAVSGDELTLSVALQSAEYEYPIDVDPTVVEESTELANEFSTQSFLYSGWQFYTPFPSVFEEEHTAGWENSCAWSGCIDLNVSFPERVEFSPGQWAEFYYETQGASQIYAATATTDMNDGVKEGKRQVEGSLRIQSAAGVEGSVALPSGTAENTLCTHAGCAAGTVESAAHHNANGVYFEQEAAASGTLFENRLTHAAIAIVQEAGPSVAFNSFLEHGPYGELNALHGSRWTNSHEKNGYSVLAEASDPGTGLYTEKWYSPQAPSWGYTTGQGGFSPGFDNCKGIQCGASLTWGYPLESEVWSGSKERLPDGEDTVEVEVGDAVGLKAKATTKVKIDSTAPHALTLSNLPSTHEIVDGQHVLLKASAKDGEGTTPSSGVASLRLTMDGQEIGTPAKGCAAGPCTANGEWTLSGESYAAGEYTLALIATDNAGNVATEEFHVTIRHAASVTVGPGAVNPVTGEFAMSSKDVSISVPNGELGVNRSYRSRHVAQGLEGPLGAQWNLSLGAQQSLARTPSGGVILTTSNGDQTVFASKGKGEFASPAGDSGLTLSEKVVENAVKFYLAANGSVTTFALPTGSSGSTWVPSISEGAGGTNATTFAYRFEGGLVEPTEELAPVPAGVSCSPTLAKGCRALKFEYAGGETKAPGEGPSEWGEFAGHLAKVTYTAWNPASKEMATVTVAQYAYDKQGRLRTEWNPTIEPFLKTVYGYDSEGHVTAVAPPGQQPVVLEQGSVAGDTSKGRLLAVARHASTTTSALKEEMAQAAPVNTTAPTLSSTTPKVGVKISVSLSGEVPGTWSNKPFAYTYQWQDCNSSGKECSPIPGAVNQAYYPVTSDEGHTLAAQVTALNATGAGTASSLATGTVAAGTTSTPLPEPPVVGGNSVVTLEYQVPVSGSGAPHPMSPTDVAKWGQTDSPAEAMSVFPPDQPMGWPAKEYTRATISYIDGRDRVVNVAGPSGAISTTEYNLYNDVIRTLTPDNRAAALKETCESPEHCKSAELSKLLDNESVYEEKGAEPGTELLGTFGPQHTVQLASGSQVEAREHTVYSYNEGAPAGGPYHLVTKLTAGAVVAGKEESEVRTTKTSYGGQNNLGWRLRKPTSVTTDPGGLSLTHSIFYEPKTGDVTETRMPAAGAPGEEQEYFFNLQFDEPGTGKSGLKEPQGIAVTANGDEYVLDTGNNRIQEYNSTGTWLRTFGTEGEGVLKAPAGIALDTKGDVWVADTGNSRLVEFNAEGHYLAKITTEMKEPQGITVDGEGNVWIADTGDSRVEEFRAELGSWHLFTKFGTKGAGESQFSGPQGIAIGAEGNIYVADTGNSRIDEWRMKYGILSEHVANFGAEGSGTGQLKAPHDLSTNSAGDVWVADTGNSRIEEFSSTGTFMQVFGKEGTGQGKLKAPKGLAGDPEGDIWVANTASSNVQQWTPNGNGYPKGTLNAHETRFLYYSAAKGSSCGEHAEWANLPCETRPAEQPGGTLPKLQYTTYRYNLWDEPETTVNGIAGTGTIRTTTNTYDAAGRLKTTAISSAKGAALPTVASEYNSETGALTKQSTEEGKKAVTSSYNTLGQLTSYTDSREDTSTYEYDSDGRVKKMNDGKGVETYSYNGTTGFLTELTNEFGTSKLAFTGSYDAEGNLLTEGYPNGMTATYTYNATAKPTALEYKKTTHCTEEHESCRWFTDSAVPSIHGQWLSQTSSLSKQAYSYDNAGRLTQVQNTPTGGKCTTRIYSYEADTNRTGLTTDESNAKGECASEKGIEEKHTYDTADRLTDASVKYDEFGNITALPATDAGGKEPSEELTSTYYTDNQVATQSQDGETVGYNLDPAQRPVEVDTTGTKVANTTLHYASSGSTPAWTENSTGETSRNIAGVNGMLAAVQAGTETPSLQVTNLHGDIVATASASETAMALSSRADTSEFGVPTTSLPPKYSWLGALEIPSELPSGVLNMGVRSYVPELGRFLQPDPVSGGSANSYAYTFGDPVNASDPTGAASMPSAWSIATSTELASEKASVRAAEEAAARAIAEAEAQRAAEAAAAFAAQEAEWAAWWASYDPWGGEAEWGEEEVSEEEWAELGVSLHPGERGQPSPLVEEGLLFQPAGSTGENGTPGKHVVAVCVAHSSASGHPCIRYVNIISELGGDLHKGWDAIKHVGSNVIHKGVKVFNWLRKESCEKYQRVGCNSIGNTASNCEVVGFATMVAGFGPEDAAFTKGLQVSGLVTWAAC